jgi:hypothetical protein
MQEVGVEVKAEVRVVKDRDFHHAEVRQVVEVEVEVEME